MCPGFDPEIWTQNRLWNQFDYMLHLDWCSRNRFLLQDWPWWPPDYCRGQVFRWWNISQHFCSPMSWKQWNMSKPVSWSSRIIGDCWCSRSESCAWRFKAVVVVDNVAETERLSVIGVLLWSLVIPVVLLKVVLYVLSINSVVVIIFVIVAIECPVFFFPVVGVDW